MPSEATVCGRVCFPDDMIAGIDEMLSKGISFSLYMTHGGTNWGHWAGANSPGFAPDVTSYDYDAPISESGRTTGRPLRVKFDDQSHWNRVTSPKLRRSMSRICPTYSLSSP